MNNSIIQNLFELWSVTGKALGRLTETDDFKVVTVDDSDWPNRVFDVNMEQHAIVQILRLIENGSLPEFLTLEREDKQRVMPGMDLFMSQINMAMPLPEIEANYRGCDKILEVNSPETALYFAQTASVSFGYKVDSRVITKLMDKPNLHLYYLKYKRKAVTCGILFFDKNNNAGLHMIGTLPEFRGKGLGKSMTLFLMNMAQKNNKAYAVLQASAMGEPLYRKLGFLAYQNIDTYRLNSKKINSE